jgi:hypothetical protein
MTLSIMTLSTMTSNIMLSVFYVECRVFDIVMLSVVMLNVVAPFKLECCYFAMQERLARDKNYRILGPLIIYEENELLCIQPQEPVT